MPVTCPVACSVSQLGPCPAHAISLCASSPLRPLGDPPLGVAIRAGNPDIVATLLACRTVDIDGLCACLCLRWATREGSQKRFYRCKVKRRHQTPEVPQGDRWNRKLCPRATPNKVQFFFVSVWGGCWSQEWVCTSQSLV